MRPLERDRHGRRAVDTLASVAELDAYAAALEGEGGPLLNRAEFEALEDRRRDLLAVDLSAQRAEALRCRGRAAR